METDWKEILNLSQKDLKQTDKETLCESLCWMDADDIELNFTDLKTLFKLAQDILKYKTEHVNNLLGKEKRKVKTKNKGTITDSEALSSGNVIETIAHQEEVIKSNKDILEQLYSDIAELEGRKSRYEKINIEEQSSESSRNTLSEVNAIAQLESEISKKNRHIRKLLHDVKILEEENTTLRDKLTIFKEKLKESTVLIESITEQLFNINKENSNVKETLGNIEREKVNLLMEIENMKADLLNKDAHYEKVEEDVKTKLQHMKHSLKSHKFEIERLTQENAELRKTLTQTPKSTASPKKKTEEEIKIQELQEKLLEASEKMVQSANLIQVLKSENKKLKLVIEEMPDSMSEQKNVSDDGKEKQLIAKLKDKIENLNDALQRAGEMVILREGELAEITGQLQLLKSEEGISALIEGMKNRKRDIKIKDQGIKSLVQEVNQLNELVNNLQMENETMRHRLKIPQDENIETYGIVKKMRDLEKATFEKSKKLQAYENKLITAELVNREKDETILKLKKIIKLANIDESKFEVFIEDKSDENDIKTTEHYTAEDVQAIIEENEGLRNGLAEILDFLKDNSTSCSGVLSLQCPSLDTLLSSMEARKSAGWYSPHMKTVMELKAAQGGKDALLHALHESRKESYQILSKLAKEEQKAKDLEKTIQEIKTMATKKIATEDKTSSTADVSIGEFGSWVLNADENFDIKDQTDIQNIIMKGNVFFERQIKQALEYFENKFTNLYEKFTTLVITTSDQLNDYSIKEERYKIEIENLKSQIEDVEDDTSNHSPGLINVPKTVFSDRKYAYLQESYKQIRTMNENIKNELLESKKERMLEISAYEKKIQNLILSVVTLTDKLRYSISLDLFFKQNESLNEINVKYRNVMEVNTYKCIKSNDLSKRLEDDKLDLIRRFHCDVQNISQTETLAKDKILTDIEQSILQKQLKQICDELQNKNVEIETLQRKIMDLQNTQADIMNKSINSDSKEDIIFLKDQLQKLNEENKIIKEQYQHVTNQLQVVALQLNSYQQKEFSNEIEINMLRHQILDLQSLGDNKAIIARLSGEVLLSQMQASEYQEKIEALKITLNKEKQLRAETEEILMNRQNVFNIYSRKYEKKIRNLTDIIDILRQQYQGSLPLISIEAFLDNVEEYYRKCCAIEEKLNEIEDLRSNLITKHTIYNQILDLSSTKCLEDEDTCRHKLKNIITEETQKLQIDHYNQKLLYFEQNHKRLLERCSFLEKTLLLVNQGFKANTSPVNDYQKKTKQTNDLQIEDIYSDEDSSIEGDHTITLSYPKIDIKLLQKNDKNDENNDQSYLVQRNEEPKSVENRHTQTMNDLIKTEIKFTQTNIDLSTKELKSQNDNLLYEIQEKDKTIEKLSESLKQLKQKIEVINEEKENIGMMVRKLEYSNTCKEEAITKLEAINEILKEEINNIKTKQQVEINRINETVTSENQSLLDELKKIESDKNDTITEFKQLLNKERLEYSKSLKEMQLKLKDLQTQLDQKETKATNTSDDVKETTNKYTLKICELEDKCFSLNSELSSCKAEFKSQQSEMERWKNLASERLIKMEQLGAQIKERHNQEMESYKAENQHWISQLNETQREHMELRARLTEQKTLHMKQIAEKDGHIEQLRSVISNLKSQILNMQTMLTANDPSFDLSAIVEVEEVSDQHSDRLELKCESSVDFNESQDDLMRMPCNSTAIWQEPILERLRREKQLMSKQNAMLRRQIKALAARERRSRLDAQNLKNQVFRISTSGNKVPSAESAVLQGKVATLQAQLAGARRDATSSLALWDKCKRAQQASERWQARYEEKCQEISKLESSLNLAKSAIARLEKEKRILISRLSDDKQEKHLAIEKHDAEVSEKDVANAEKHSARTEMAVSERALYARVEAQQRRIVALELAERGNETLVTEYEKALAEITSLKGQVLKLESTLLEAQIKSPLQNSDQKPELDYWKNYCDMLKEENTQLSLRVSALENSAGTGTGTGAGEPQRVARLQHTVLTLRGLVSKLQAEQKTLNSQKRNESRPGSAKSGNEKFRNQDETYRIEITNLKKSNSEKDELLQKSREMLNMALEKNERLARENMFLRQRLEELSE